jgi:hypothetical protein
MNKPIKGSGFFKLLHVLTNCGRWRDSPLRPATIGVPTVRQQFEMYPIKGKKIYLLFFAFIAMTVACTEPGNKKLEEKTLINSTHLNHLYFPVIFKTTGVKAAGIYIYAEAPDYHLTGDSDEGFTCVDDVSRALLFYVRSSAFFSDTAVQNKSLKLLRFLLEMQSPEGYFYNFLFPDGSINKDHVNSTATPNWWSWRALHALTEASPLLKKIDAQVYEEVNTAINKLVTKIKTDLVHLPKATKIVSGILVPQWLPGGSGTDQAALLIISLIPYAKTSNDTSIIKFIRKLSDGIVMMQHGDQKNLPYSCFLSWENTWHAWGNDQSFALLQAGAFLNDTTYTNKALAEINNFYPWLLQKGMRTSFEVIRDVGRIRLVNEKRFDQIAYGIRPMVFASIEAYRQTGEEKYAGIAAKLAAWFFGANAPGITMYDSATGRCYDGIISQNNINRNSGAESTIEALLTIQVIEQYPAIKAALKKY